MTDTQPEPTDPTAATVTAPARRRGRRAALIAAVAVVVLAGASTAVVLTTSGDGSDPVQAVKDYDAVFKQKDCEGFNDLTTSGFRAKLGLTTCAKFDNNAKDASIASFRLTVRSSDVRDDTASVRTEETFSSEAGQQTVKLVYALVKDDGVWLVDGITADKSV